MAPAPHPAPASTYTSSTPFMDSFLSSPATFALAADANIQNDPLLLAVIPTVINRLTYYKRQNDPSAPPASLHDAAALLADHTAALRAVPSHDPPAQNSPKPLGDSAQSTSPTSANGSPTFSVTMVNLLGPLDSPNDGTTAATARGRPSPRLSLGRAIAAAGAQPSAGPAVPDAPPTSTTLDEPSPPPANDTDVVSPPRHPPAEPQPPSPTPPDRPRPNLVFGDGLSAPPPPPHPTT
jgi:hypothetical protein